jgi:hypothetical protein
MKVILEKENPCSERHAEVREAIECAIDLVRDKRGFKNKNGGGYVWDAELRIYISHNIYTSQIHLQSTGKDDKWAYYCNGRFWTSTGFEVGLI